MLKQYPSKFIGCCLANPAEDGTGIKQLEDLISKVQRTSKYQTLWFRFAEIMLTSNFVCQDGYRAVRFNPHLWPSGQLVWFLDQNPMQHFSNSYFLRVNVFELVYFSGLVSARMKVLR